MLRKILIGIETFTLFYVILNIGCEDSSAKVNTPDQNQLFINVTASEAYLIVQDNDRKDNFKILDVRSPEEYLAEHIAKAVNIPLESDQFSQELSQLKKDDSYLVYCRGGCKSSAAVEIMKRGNFKTVINMLGGIKKWKELELPTFKLRESKE